MFSGRRVLKDDVFQAFDQGLEKGTDSMQKGIEINFYDLVHRMAKKWFVLVAFILAFAFLADFYGYHRSITAAEKERKALAEYAESIGSTVEALPEHVTAELAALRGELTEEEASFVEAIAKLYMYRMWASDKINQELIVGEPDGGDLEIVQTLYYANEGVQSAIQVMTSAEKSYYNVLVKELSGTDMSITEKDISSPGLLQPKWLVIGAVLGLLLGACMIAMVYVLSGKLRVPEDMEVTYHVPVLATVNSTASIELESTAKGIRRLMQEKQLTRLAISAANTERAKAISEEMIAVLMMQNISTSLVSSNQGVFAGEVCDVDAVLFVEQVGKSRYSEIENRTAVCRNYCIPIAGAIVIIK